MTFILLLGYAPFGNDLNARCIFSLELDEEESAKISAAAKDFIEKLMRMSPVERMGLDKACSHHWLAKVSDQSTLNSRRLITRLQI
jgi:serine/threonine protein kinase